MSNRPMALATSFGVTTAINEITQNGTTGSKTDQVSARTIVLPNSFLPGTERLQHGLRNRSQAASSAPMSRHRPKSRSDQERDHRTASVSRRRIRSPRGATRLSFRIPAALSAARSRSTIARDWSVSRFPTAGLRLLRSELSSVAVRAQPVRNANDSDVLIPATGFTLAGTLTVPQAVGRLRQPAVVLVAGSGSVDRDEVVASIPIFAQLAERLAEQGFLVLRYDKRGVGQSGGRNERVTLARLCRRSRSPP